ncbi:hypothetical protein ACFLXB_08875 [Chloroflexota bacterium]
MDILDKNIWVKYDNTVKQIDQTNRSACKAIQDLSFTTTYTNFRISNAFQIVQRYLELDESLSEEEQRRVFDCYSKSYLEDIEKMIEAYSSSITILAKLNPLERVLRYVIDGIFSIIKGFLGLFINMKGDE